jgi:hypothetical protein
MSDDTRTPITLNLTQHAATADQIAAGVVDLSEGDRQWLIRTLTFAVPPDMAEMVDRARTVFAIASASLIPHDRVMLGGAPFFTTVLEVAATLHRETVVYAFSQRETIEQAQPDGSVRKTQVFRHAGFVPGAGWRVFWDGWNGASLGDGPWPSPLLGAGARNSEQEG